MSIPVFFNFYGFVFIQTHDCCPETYTVYLNGDEYAQVSLHWGELICKVKDEVVYKKVFEYNWQGIFLNQGSRETELYLVALKLKKFNSQKETENNNNNS